MTRRLELPKFQAFDSNGDPLSGGLVYTYAAGTSTLKTTYSDYDASTANANPVVLDARGEAMIYLQGSYKINLTDSAGAQIPGWPVDNIQGGVGADAGGEDFHYPDATAADQGVTGNSDTIKYAVDSIFAISPGEDNGTIYLKHDSTNTPTTTYTLTTSETLPKNVFLKPEPGAIIDGAGTLTLYSPEHILCGSDRQLFGTSVTVAFTNPGVVYPEWWGALGDGSDDSTAIQAAIDAMESALGGTVQFLNKEYKCNLEIKSFVTLMGMEAIGHTGSAAGATRNNKTRLLASATGSIIDTAVGSVTEPIIIGINFEGLGAGTALKGIHFRNVTRGVIRDCGFDNFADEAIRIADGPGNKVSNCLGINILLDTTRAAHTGALHLEAANETRVDSCEFSGGSALTDANMYNKAFCLGSGATGNWLTKCQGTGLDAGFYVAGDHNHIFACTADINWGHGFELSSAAQSNILTTCFSHRNSKETTDTYDAFKAGVSSNNMFVGCMADYASGDGWSHKYGFNDTSANVSPAYRNKYIGCSVGTGAAVTADWNFTGASGFHPILPDGGYIAATDADTTPSVLGAGFLYINNTGATTITNFDDAVNGQKLTVMNWDDGNTTLEHGGFNALYLLAKTDIKLPRYTTTQFQYYNGTWYQIANNAQFASDTTAAGAGTDGTISSRSAGALGEADGFLELYKDDGTLVYVPYWEDITP